MARLDVDVLALQELDVHQPRSHRADQAALAAQALGAVDWRFAPTLAGTPGGAWSPTADGATGTPGADRAAGDGADREARASDSGGTTGAGTAQAGDDADRPGPHYGVALASRLPVRGWHVLPLGHGRGALPMRVTHPVTGRTGVRWIPDEPRVALAAELAGLPLVVVTAHLSFAPVTAWRQLRRLRDWATGLGRPGGAVLLAGDLNLPGRTPALLTGGRSLVRTPTFPAAGPSVQLDHLLAFGPQARTLEVTRLLLPDPELADHLPIGVRVRPAAAG